MADLLTSQHRIVRSGIPVTLDDSLLFPCQVQDLL